MLIELNHSMLKKQPNESFFILMDDITQESCRGMVEWILGSNYADEPPEMLTLFINSAGGDLAAGFAVIDMMRGSAIPIRTVGIGSIASAGLMIFMAGQPGMRILTPNTSVMSHRFSWGTNSVKQHELLAMTKEYDFTAKRIINHYKKCTGLPEAEIISKLLPPEDVWLDAKEAKKLGICDIVKELK